MRNLSSSAVTHFALPAKSLYYLRVPRLLNSTNISISISISLFISISIPILILIAITIAIPSGASLKAYISSPDVFLHNYLNTRPLLFPYIINNVFCVVIFYLFLLLP